MDRASKGNKIRTSSSKEHRENIRDMPSFKMSSKQLVQRVSSKSRVKSASSKPPLQSASSKSRVQSASSKLKKLKQKIEECGQQIHWLQNELKSTKTSLRNRLKQESQTDNEYSKQIKIIQVSLKDQKEHRRKLREILLIESKLAHQADILEFSEIKIKKAKNSKKSIRSKTKEFAASENQEQE